MKKIKQLFYRLKEFSIYSPYTFSSTCTVEKFDANKYADRMKIENTHYVYDELGRIMAVVCAPTQKKAERMCRRYIIRRKFGLIRLAHWFNGFFKSL